MQKIWKVSSLISKDFQNKFPEINPIILQLLANRGLKNQKKIDEFLQPDYSQDIHDPFLLKDMEKAVRRIYQAIKNNEKVVIYGDYDTDGVTSSTILFEVFKKIGVKNLQVYIPDRQKDGYGLNKKAIKDFIKQKINLIVTCDCGVSNIEEINLANKSNIDVIVTDHHREPSKLPDCLAIINPQLSREKYPFKFLAGAGVAFKLIQGLLKDKDCPLSDREATEKWLLDLVALGTIADFVPLLGENRVLSKYGLVVLNKTRNLGLKSLIKYSSLEMGSLNAGHVGFQLSPRINAAGRINHATDALGLFLSVSQDEADEHAQHLNLLNNQRQKITEKVFKSIKVNEKDKIIVALKEDWPGGVLGLVANKLVDAFSRPALVLRKEGKNLTGSGRSTEGFDLFSFLKKENKYFKAFGGHRGAVGFTLKGISCFDDFKQEILERAEQILDSDMIAPKLSIDAEINLDDINWNLYEELIKFEPFGCENPQPNFLLKNILLEKIQSVGKNNQHYRLFIEGGRKMIYFNSMSTMANFKPGQKIDIVFKLDVNQWNGTQELQMKVVDLKRSRVD
ncbi:single-stranded-DNA-specific exonuclease RecJ [bacterium]|nr:single-stranded-DNA-specific exonuclease RecJ [bacterium]